MEQLPSRISRPAMLPSLVRFPARPPRQAHFGIRSTDPVHPLSTLQTPCCHDACKTRSWPVCSTLARPDFHRQVDTSFPNALPHVLIPDGMATLIIPGCAPEQLSPRASTHQFERAQLPRPRVARYKLATFHSHKRPRDHATFAEMHTIRLVVRLGSCPFDRPSEALDAAGLWLYCDDGHARHGRGQ